MNKTLKTLTLTLALTSLVMALGSQIPTILPVSPVTEPVIFEKTATFSQQNSAAGVVIKNAATFDPAYPPMKFVHGSGAYDVGSFYINPEFDIVLGVDAGGKIIPGSMGENLFIGYEAGFSQTDALWNIFLGAAAGYNNLTGGLNTAIGLNALYETTAGRYNIAIGPNSITYASRPQDCIGIGDYADFYSAGAPAAALAAGTALEVGEYGYIVSFVFGATESATGRIRITTTTSGNQKVNLSSIATYSGPLTCTARNIYRTKVNNLATFYLLTTIGNNSTTTYADTTADGALGAELTNYLPSYSISIGTLANTMFSNTAVIGGGTGYQITDYYLNNAWSASPVSIVLHSQGGSGANVAGSDFTIAPGQGTGTGAGGSFKIKVAPAGTTGSTWNALRTAVEVNSKGEIGLSSDPGDADFDTDEVLVTQLTAGLGQLMVGETTGNALGIWKVENTTLTAMSVNVIYSSVKDNAATYNVYYEGGVLKVQNKVGDNKAVKVAWLKPL